MSDEYELKIPEVLPDFCRGHCDSRLGPTECRGYYCSLVHQRIAELPFCIKTKTPEEIRAMCDNSGKCSDVDGLVCEAHMAESDVHKCWVGSYHDLFRDEDYRLKDEYLTIQMEEESQKLEYGDYIIKGFRFGERIIVRLYEGDDLRMVIYETDEGKTMLRTCGHRDSDVEVSNEALLAAIQMFCSHFGIKTSQSSEPKGKPAKE